MIDVTRPLRSLRSVELIVLRPAAKSPAFRAGSVSAGFLAATRRGRLPAVWTAGGITGITR